VDWSQRLVLVVSLWCSLSMVTARIFLLSPRLDPCVRIRGGGSARTWGERRHHHGQHRPLTSCLACCIRNLQPGFQRKIFNSPAPNDMFQFAPTNRRPLSPIGIGACGLHENSKATTRTSYTGFLAQLSIHYGRCHVESWLMTHALLWTNQWKDQCPTRTLDIQFRPRTL
jgi:hypothetical protein